MAKTLAALVAVAAASTATCGPDAVQSFASDYAAAFCRRAFECCATADLPSVAKATDETACVTMARNNLDREVGQRALRLSDGGAAARTA